MTKPRSAQISLDQTPYYHVVNRCVRRAFLCGVDSVTGQSYEHRREWIEQRMMQLASVFAVDIAAFAIMSNHYHIVVRVDREQALSWSDDEVLSRWIQLFSSTINIQQYLALKEAQKPIPDYLQDHAAEMAELYRHRLYDLSWFMRILNESIARMANKEDGVKGRFWEGRFKSQAILDEAALMSVMAYVDLNPVRANIAQDLPSSDFTSIQARLRGKYQTEMPPETKGSPSKHAKVQDETEQEKTVNAFLERLHALPFSRLLPFNKIDSSQNAIPFAFEQYLEFVDYLGRAVHPSKRGYITEEVPLIMEQLGINSAIIEAFQTGKFLESFADVIGSKGALNQMKSQQQKALNKGAGLAGRIFL